MGKAATHGCHAQREMLYVNYATRRDTISEYVNQNLYQILLRLLALASVSAAASNYLRKSIVESKVNGVKLNALINTGSSLSFINYLLLRNVISRMPYLGRITMANSSLSTEIIDRCNVKLEMKGHTYSEVEMLVMKNFCSDAIIGHDTLQSHSLVDIVFQGRRPALKICSLAIAKVPPVSLFANLTPDCAPIATKSRKCSNEDGKVYSF